MHRSFKKGDVIIRRGSYETCAYIIESGIVEVSSVVNEKKAVFATLGEKQIFGEMSLMEDKPRSATVTALEDTLVSVIDRKDFNEQLTRNPKVLFPLIKALFERLRTANKNIVMKECLSPETWKTKEKEPEKKRLAILSGLNETGVKALGSNAIKIETFPYKIGRKSTLGEDDVFTDNDLCLEDITDTPPFNISSNHFLIDMVNDKYVVVDRGSSLGTIVNGKKIEEPCILDKKENGLAIGSQDSPFVFKLEIM